MDEIPSSSTLRAGSLSPAPIVLDLRKIPPITILAAHFKDDEQHQLQETLYHHGAPLTSDVSKANLFIGKVGTKRRAEFELRSRKLKVEEILETKRKTVLVKRDRPPAKRRKIQVSLKAPITVEDEGSTTEEETDKKSTVEESETEDELPILKPDVPRSALHEAADNTTMIFENETNSDIVWVVKVDWLEGCIESGCLLPLGEHLVYKGKILERPPPTRSAPRSIRPYFSSSPVRSSSPASRAILATHPLLGKSILERAKSDVTGTASTSKYVPETQSGHGSRRFENKSYYSSTAKEAGHTASQTAHLLQQTTSEYNGTDSDIPEAPEWVKQGIKYACQRFTPANGPNEDFIDLLKQIRTARTLIDDEIGVRAYSTIIASIAAYPYKLIHPREIIRLPGCDNKVANLLVEYKNTGTLQAVEEFESDEAMKILREFYDIWGVGAKTARHFYYKNNWTELDDIIEFGWNDLDRVQQIGLKYYDEFKDRIPRNEVESIAEVVRQHAIKLRDERITVTIVGGYRRGKELSGDVDMIVSHPDLDATAYLVKDLIEALEDDEWITHTLTLSLNNTSRGQGTLPFRTTKASGAGFDTLDKALVVWQDPYWPSREADLAENPKAKNPNIHRRVDIILAPWRTVGCAVMGWSSGTTFQRDLRRYCKYMKGWKFDSSGVRSRRTGDVVQLEGEDGVDGTPEDAERKVFEGLGLVYVPPDQRCTN
ncbi:Nucleotidyltransferase [Lophiostoma macrostomum CBS 122681]|uniref:DNA polymerase lambda n=1 Tax=Lophiostoma macrostomum CBS 122681 TaxID=1314788 RepID=A0A6A6TE84_9PLEO|nr:Nucleotidyltransferase [Lophiostoma macrostomum CBS 122681]